MKQLYLINKVSLLENSLLRDFLLIFFYLKRTRKLDCFWEILIFISGRLILNYPECLIIFSIVSRIQVHAIAWNYCPPRNNQPKALKMAMEYMQEVAKTEEQDRHTFFLYNLSN